MRCAGTADDVLARLGFMGQCFLVESISLLLNNGSVFFSFVLSFCKSNNIHKKNLTMTINTDAANMQKSNK